MEDQRKIENDSKLTDKHINFANSLISRQFPNIRELWSTLLQNRYYCFPLHSVQPIFVRSKSTRLWLQISSKNSSFSKARLSTVILALVVAFRFTYPILCIKYCAQCFLITVMPPYDSISSCHAIHVLTTPPASQSAVK